MADTLRDAVSSASAELNTEVRDTEPRESRETRDVPRETIEHDDDDFGAPKWVKGQWKKDAREALRKLHSYPDASEPLARVYKEIEEKYNENKSGKKEFDTYRSRFSRYENFLPQLEQEFAYRGQDPVVGIQQLMSYQQLLQSDPDRGLAQLAQLIKPRDAKAVFQQLASQWGVDLSGLAQQFAQQQDWIDPAVKRYLEPLQQQNQQMQQAMMAEQQRQQYMYQQQLSNAQVTIAQSIKALDDAKDENGELKYPHRVKLDGPMSSLIEKRGIFPMTPTGYKTLEEVYSDAIWLDPELREEAIKAHAKATAPKVIEDTHRTNAIAETAKRASRNVNGGTRTPTAKPLVDLRDVIRSERKRLEAR